MIGIGIYVKDSLRAVTLYSRAFGLTLGYHVLNSDGTYFHSELMRDGEPFCSVVESRTPTFAERHPIELGVTFDSCGALEHAFSLLSDGGRIDMQIGELPWSPCAAIVTDCFGVRWFLTMPQHQPDEDWKPEE